MHLQTISLSELLNGFTKKPAIFIVMNKDRKLRDYFLKFFKIKVSLNEVNMITFASIQETLSMWNEISKTKSIPMYVFHNTLISTNE